MEKMHLNETNNEPHITHMDDEYQYQKNMDTEELTMMISNCLNDSGFWKDLGWRLELKYNLDLWVGDAIHDVACQIEMNLTELILEKYQEQQ